MKRIQKQAIAHYDRMIEWAKKQPQRKIPDDCDMLCEIGENWFSNGCTYCLKYFDGSCDTCALQAKRGCCNGLWESMNRSETWGTWVKRAEKVRQYIIDNG